jgi:transposase
MAAGIGVRSDYTSADLRRFARRSGDADQVRRRLAVAVILDGGSRSEAARVAGVTLQIVRDWVLRFNEGGPDGLATRRAPGRASILNDEQRARLAGQVEAGPIPAAHGVVRWRLVDLVQWIRDEFELSVTRHTLGRELRAMGYRKLSARPRHHGQKPDDIVDFKKLRHPSGADQAAAPERNASRAVVAGRSPRRPADQAHPALGQARHPPLCAE